MGAVLGIAMFSLLTPRASATTTFLSNLPVDDGLSLALFNTQAYGAGFTMTTDYDFESVVLRLRVGSQPLTAAQIVVSLYNDSGGHPGSEIQLLSGLSSFPANTISDYVFTPSTSLSLQSGVTYWLVVRNNLAVTTFYLQASYPPVVPTGSGATYVETQFANPYGLNWNHQVISGQDVGPGLSLNGTTVPEPATLSAMALGLLGLLAARRLRRARAIRR